MTKKTVHRMKGLPDLLRSGRGWWLSVVFAAICLTGYSLALSSQARAQALPTAPPPPVSPGPQPATPGDGACAAAGDSCEAPGTASAVATSLVNAFYTELQAGAYAEEHWLFTYVGQIMTGAYDQLDWLENEMIDFWNTMWNYNLLPGLQGMTREINIGQAQQAMQTGANADATATMGIVRSLNKHEIEDRVDPGEQVCVAASSSGGFTITTGFSRAMRQAWENDSIATGLNTTTDANGKAYPGAASAVGAYQQMYQDYHNIFCDPGANGGNNNCGASTSLASPLYNADVEPIKYIYNRLTIPVDKTTNPTEGADMEIAVADTINNMVGLPAADPMVPSALISPQGRQAYMLRRSYIARYAAVRSVPDMVASWRMPGSQMGLFISDLRKNAGVDIRDISMNPSYKEIMHELSVDRFETGRYASGMLTDSNKVEMEKLNLSVFYLMQLRDYYELLERTALTLAVQVSILSEQQMQSLPDIYTSAVVK